MFRGFVERVTTTVGEEGSHSIMRMTRSIFTSCDISPKKTPPHFEVLIRSKFQQHLCCFEDLVRTRIRLCVNYSKYNKIIARF